jgi:hypothetical protein
MRYHVGMARPKSMDTRKMFSLPADLAAAVEDYRFAARIKTESEAIRRLLRIGLEASGLPPKPVRRREEEVPT